jgi:sialic acid synthase SpsE
MLKIISEIGINHNGDFRLIEELIRQSSVGGADFAKFQLYDSMRVFGDDSRKKNEFTFAQVKLIKEICDAYDIEFFASVFDEEKINWCQELKVNYFKIASRTLKKEPALTKTIVDTGVETFISLGQWDQEVLPYRESNVRYFNCISKYPTSVLELSKNSYRNYDSTIIGFSDHSYGIANCLHHISLGANYIEKHFTLDKSASGNDHIGSMDLNELKLLSELGRQIFLIRKLTS